MNKKTIFIVSIIFGIIILSFAFYLFIVREPLPAETLTIYSSEYGLSLSPD